VALLLIRPVANLLKAALAYPKLGLVGMGRR
jgi:hypothetical protein